MDILENRNSLGAASKMDDNDPLRGYRDLFHIPKDKEGNELIYLCGNSLGLMPKTAEEYVNQELRDWKNLGVEGHFHAKHPWMPYHEFLTDAMSEIVGAKKQEVVVMNTLTTNLHLLMVSFYRPTKERRKILIESDAFPSDLYAVESQIRFHGFDPKEDLIKVFPKIGAECIEQGDLYKIIEDQGEEIALILLGGVNYYTGQAFDLKKTARVGHSKGCVVGFDLAHAAGNLKLELHDSGIDFAAWCSYKYLNSSPGSLSGVFVHERHANDNSLPRFAGWWGHDKASRFNMRQEFNPIPGAEGWQLSNPPILPLAVMRSSLDIFKQAGMENLVEKSKKLTAYMEELVHDLDNNKIDIITPADPKQRGCQLSIQVEDADKSLYDNITNSGVIADWREPDVIRVAPVPLYNSFVDVYNFVEILKANL